MTDRFAAEVTSSFDGGGTVTVDKYVVIVTVPPCLGGWVLVDVPDAWAPVLTGPAGGKETVVVAIGALPVLTKWYSVSPSLGSSVPNAAFPETVCVKKIDVVCGGSFTGRFWLDS